jgi:uncharacterized protein YkwD
MVGTRPRSSVASLGCATAFLIGVGFWVAPPRIAASRDLADFGHQESGDEPAARPKVNPATATEQLIEAHNRLRKAEKLSTLSPSKKLQAAAEAQARDMAARSKMTHEGTDGSTISDRVRAQEYDYRRIAENIAYGEFTIDQVMEGWMDSEVHRKNILGSFSQIGAAVAIDKDQVPYWCVTFGLPRRK